MKYNILCYSIFLIAITTDIAAQDTVRKKSGFDADLYNGTIYNFGTTHIKGHQFLEEQAFKPGILTIGEYTYPGLLLNYDIFNQKVLFKMGEGHQRKLISVPTEVIESFSIGPRKFIVLEPEKWKRDIYETIGDKQLRFMRKWSKETRVSAGNDVYRYEFTKPVVSTFLAEEQAMTRLKRRRDFVERFPQKHQAALKKYMRQNRIRFRKASFTELQRLIDYCYTIQ